MFDTIKYKLRKILEIIYFFGIKDYQLFSYDEDIKKYVKSTNKYSRKRGLECMFDWYDGESTFLDFLRMKTEYMFYKLKKDGNQSYWYVDTFELFSFKATEDDRTLVFNTLIEDLKNYEIASHKYSHSGTPNSFISEAFIYAETNVDDSDSKRATYWLTYDSSDKTYSIRRKTYQTIPSNEIPKNKKLYELDFNNLYSSKESTQYRTKEDKILCQSKNIEEIIEYLNNTKGGNWKKDFISNIYTIDIRPETYKNFSPYIQQCSRGLRIQLKDLLHFRHLIKRIQLLSEDDSALVNVSSEEFKTVSEKIRENYLKKRSQLYKELCDFFVERSESWWD